MQPEADDLAPVRKDIDAVTRPVCSLVTGRGDVGPGLIDQGDLGRAADTFEWRGPKDIERYAPDRLGQERVAHHIDVDGGLSTEGEPR